MSSMRRRYQPSRFTLGLSGLTMGLGLILLPSSYRRSHSGYGEPAIGWCGALMIFGGLAADFTLLYIILIILRPTSRRVEEVRAEDSQSRRPGTDASMFPVCRYNLAPPPPPHPLPRNRRRRSRFQAISRTDLSRRTNPSSLSCQSHMGELAQSIRAHSLIAVMGTLWAMAAALVNIGRLVGVVAQSAISTCSRLVWGHTIRYLAGC